MRPTGEISGEQMQVTCDDCFFRRAELCAIPGNRPCPTFRPVNAVRAPGKRPQPVAKVRVPAVA